MALPHPDDPVYRALYPSLFNKSSCDIHRLYTSLHLSIQDCPSIALDDVAHHLNTKTDKILRDGTHDKKKISEAYQRLSLVLQEIIGSLQAFPTIVDSIMFDSTQKHERLVKAPHLARPLSRVNITIACVVGGFLAYSVMNALTMV